MLQYILFCIALLVSFINVFVKNPAFSLASIMLFAGTIIVSIGSTSDIYLQLASVTLAIGNLITGFLLIFKKKGV